MEIARQRLETADLRRWVDNTHHCLIQAQDLLNDLNTFPVPNFNTGTNLVASWSEIATVAQRQSPALAPGQFMANLANTAAAHPHGSIGMFLAAALVGAAKTCTELEYLRPADLVLAFQGIEEEFRTLEGPNSLGNALSALAGRINEELASLEFLTLSAVAGTALVCAQEASVESAEAHQGVGDAGLAGSCLILAAFLDVATAAEGDTPAGTMLVEAMLEEWANRSRPVVQTLRRTPPGGEFEVTFHHQGYATELESLRGGLAPTCSEALILMRSDELGLARFTTHVHTPAPLSALPHPHEPGVLVRHLTATRNPAVSANQEEDPLDAGENVVVLSRAVAQRVSRSRLGLLVLSEASALTDAYARSGAVVLLHAQDTSQLSWAHLECSEDIALVIPSSENTWRLAQTWLDSHQAEGRWLVAPTRNELAAALLVEALSGKEFSGEADSWLPSLEMLVEQQLSQFLTEELDETTLAQQLQNLLAFTSEPEPELFAILGSSQSAVERMNLQLWAANYDNLALTTYYGGQPGPTVIGLRS